MGIAEGGRVAHIPGNRGRAMPVTDAAQTPADIFQGGGPAHPLESAVGPSAQWVQHPVGVILHLGHCNSLGAGIAARNWMLRVRAQGHYTPVLDCGPDATERLANPAEGQALLGWHSPSSSVDAAHHRDCTSAGLFSKLNSVKVARLLALMAVIACGTPANGPAASAAPSPAPTAASPPAAPAAASTVAKRSIRME